MAILIFLRMEYPVLRLKLLRRNCEGTDFIPMVTSWVKRHAATAAHWCLFRLINETRPGEQPYSAHVFHKFAVVGFVGLAISFHDLGQRVRSKFDRRKGSEAPPDAALIARAELTALGVQEFHGEKATNAGTAGAERNEGPQIHGILDPLH